MTYTPPKPAEIYEDADYDGCRWAIVSTDYDMEGWSLVVDGYAPETSHPFELGEAWQADGNLMVFPGFTAPRAPAWLAFIGRGRARGLVAPDGTRC